MVDYRSVLRMDFTAILLWFMDDVYLESRLYCGWCVPKYGDVEILLTFRIPWDEGSRIGGRQRIPIQISGEEKATEGDEVW